MAEYVGRGGEVLVGGGRDGGIFRHTTLARANDRIYWSQGHDEVSVDGGRGGGPFRQTALAGADGWIRRSWGHSEVSAGWSTQRPLSANDARRC